LESYIGWGQLRFLAFEQFFDGEDLQFEVVFVSKFGKDDIPE